MGSNFVLPTGGEAIRDSNHQFLPEGLNQFSSGSHSSYIGSHIIK